MNSEGRRKPIWRIRLGLVLGLMVWCAPGTLRAAEPASGATSVQGRFDLGNQFYERGQFTNAAVIYHSLISESRGDSSVYFNLGNACYKAGATGRAIAAYREGLRLEPRDPNLRFNLQFVRKQVTGSESEPGSFWSRSLSQLTINEWTGLVTAVFWIWCGLLIAREIQPRWRAALRGYCASAGAALVLLGVVFAVAAYQRYVAREAVVIVSEAIVRYGPLLESQVYYKLRDGSEVEVLDSKKLTTLMGDEIWLNVMDQSRRPGWLRDDQVQLMR